MGIERSTTEDGGLVITFSGLSKGLDSQSGATSLADGYVADLSNVRLEGGVPTRMDGTTLHLPSAMPDNLSPLWHDQYRPSTGTPVHLAGGRDGHVYRWDVGTVAWVSVHEGLTTTLWSSTTQIGDYLIWTNQADGHYKWDGTHAIPLGAKFIAGGETGEATWTGGTLWSAPVKEGGFSCHLHATAGGTDGATLDPTIPWNLNAGLIEARAYADSDYIDFWFYVDHIANMVQATSYIAFGDVAGAAFFQRFATGWGTLVDGWNHVHILRSTFTIGAGAPAWSNIARMSLWIDADAGDDVEASFDEIVMRYADLMPAAMVNANWKNMYFAANSATAPSEVYYSSVSGPDEYDVDAVLAVDENDGTDVEGIFPYYDLFLIGKTNTLHTISVRLGDLLYPDYQFGLRRVTGEHGISSHRGVVEAAGRIFIWWRDSIYEYAGIGSSKVSYRVDPTLGTIAPTMVENVVALPHRAQDTVYWFWSPSPWTWNISGVAFNYVEKSLTPLVGLQAATAKTVYEGGVERPIITDYIGRFWRMGDGTQFQGVNIDSTFTLPWVSIGPPHGAVSWRELMFLYATQAAGTMTVEYRTAEHPREFTTAAWVIAETVNMTVADEEGRSFIGETSRWIQVRFHSTSAPWTLYWPVALRGVPLGYL
jgi:hypothetical protein